MDTGIYSPKHFSEHEFNSCVPPCKMSDVSPELLRLLDRIRDYVGQPIYVNSAYRTADYELLRGRSGTSSHCKGLAVDISCKSSVLRRAIVCACMMLQIPRIGVGSTFVHIDIDSSKVPCLWTY